MEVSIILPCRNEEQAIVYCIRKIKSVLKENNIKGEVIVSDSSTDNTYDLIKDLDVKIIRHNKIGYGNAYLEAFKYAQGKNIILVDADDTYDYAEIPKFLENLKHYDLVIGNRFSAPLPRNSMPFLNRYIGNPFLTLILKLFYKVNIIDAHSGFRAISKKNLEKLNLVSQGMELATEMLIEAKKHHLKVKEIPINYQPRKGESKLRPLSDGWRHLRLMLLHAPNYLFLIPGILFFIVGIFFMIIFSLGPVSIAGLPLDIHPMILASLLSILGYQILFLGVFAKTYASIHLNQSDWLVDLISKSLTIEKASTMGLLIFGIGFLINLLILIKWIKTGFGPLQNLRLSVFGFTMIVLGVQTIFSSFLLSILSIKK